MSMDGIGRVVYTSEQIKQRVAEVAAKINQDYAGEELVVICVLKGSFYFAAQLTQGLDLSVIIDFLSIGVQHEGKSDMVRFTRDLNITLTGRHVLLVEDIIGTGFTLGYICQHLETFQPASLKICTLLDKPADRLLPINIAYSCFVMSDIFVVGYGLDYKQRFRNLPYIAEYNRPK